MAVDHFEGEDVIITFEQEGADFVENFEGKITSYRRSGGASSTEDRFAFGGKTFNFQKPREKFTVEFDYVTDNTAFAHVHFGNTTLPSGNTEIKSNAVPKRFRVIAWFLPNSKHASNATRTTVVPKNGDEVYRIVHVDCKAVTNDIDFAADDMLTGTITFECSATDADGYPNIIEQYHNSSASQLATLLATTHRGTLTWNTTTKVWTGSYRT